MRRRRPRQISSHPPRGEGWRRWSAVLAGRRGAFTALAVVCALSLAARCAWLAEPCHAPCRTPAAHLLVFDEDYYVNAARVIAGVRPPHGVPYARAPLGDDPNAEHPQLGKLMMAGLIELLGDGPWAWRLPSLLLGTLCLIGMYALARVVGGSRPMALGAAALMAADNLLLVHSRIATLDVFALTGMLWGMVAYVRGRWWLAGLAIGLGACAKLVAPYALLAVVVLELLQWAVTRRALLQRAARAIGCAAVSAAVLIAGLAVMDAIAPPYDDAAGKLVRGGPLGHLRHMFTYAAHQTSPHGPQGIASYPWQWLIDLKPITYVNINPSSPARGLIRVHPSVHFLGVISPPILLAGLAGLVAAAVMTWRAGTRLGGPEEALEARGGGGVVASTAWDDEGPRAGVVALAWFAGTYLPFVALSLVDQRTSYLYYMVIVMPGLYLAAAQLAARLAHHPRWLAAWAASVAVTAVILYPFTPLP